MPRQRMPLLAVRRQCWQSTRSSELVLIGSLLVVCNGMDDADRSTAMAPSEVQRS